MDSLFTFYSKLQDDGVTDPASTDAFTDIGFLGIPGSAPSPEFIAMTSGPISANWKNTGANSIDTRVLGSNDKDAADADWDIPVVSAAIAAAGIRHISINPALYAFYKFQHKATAGGSQGKSKIRGCQHRV